MDPISIETLNAYGWPNCWRISNADVELIAAADIGPRILHFGFLNGQNEFFVDPEARGKNCGEDWRLYGGHRLWHAPEDAQRTYSPDNQPVQIELYEDGIRLVQAPEPLTGIQKEIEIHLTQQQARVDVLHRLHATKHLPVDLAPWALTAMAPGGIAIAPLPPRREHLGHLLPDSKIVLWPYTNMADPRWIWGEEFILLRQDAHVNRPQKFGTCNPAAWIAYSQPGRLFIKTVQIQSGAAYPDMGCSIECFADNRFLELETLGPLAAITPGQTHTHQETWRLIADLPLLQNEADVRTLLIPALERCG